MQYSKGNQPGMNIGMVIDLESQLEIPSKRSNHLHSLSRRTPWFWSSSTDELNAVFGEICSVVLADGSASGGPKIAAVNGVWINQSLPVDSSWKDLLVNFFKAEFAQVDFSTKKFDRYLTKNKPFHLVNGESVSVPFMSSSRNQYVKAYDGFKVLRLDYQQGRDDADRRFSMYFYLPDQRDGLDNLLKRITSTHGFLDRHIPRHKDLVGEFRIPKFKVKFGFEASEAFDDPELNVSLYQKAFLEIDEVGTEAAAATALCQAAGSCRPIVRKKIDFVADHPFLFLIREDRTGAVLFVGQIFDPSKSD
ncbi:hypothetical protein Bca4012_061308 [Brassica carinata]